MREYNEELFSIIVKLTRWPLALSNEMDERLMCPGRCTSNGRKHRQRGMNGRKVLALVVGVLSHRRIPSVRTRGT